MQRPDELTQNGSGCIVLFLFADSASAVRAAQTYIGLTVAREFSHSPFGPSQLLTGHLTLKRLGRSVASIGVVVYACLLVFGYAFADRLIFQPQASSYRDSGQIIPLISGGVRISAVFLPNPGARYTILYSHGNAEDIGELLPVLGDIQRMGFSVLAFDYRGYGTSEGRPSQQSAYQDEDAAYDYLVKTAHVPANHIIALGRSLGGGTAVDLASRRPLGGLIVQSSFVTAFRAMAHVPILPFDEFRNIDKIGKVHCPVLVIHGTADDVIAFWNGDRLFRQANEPKRSFWVEGAGHDDLYEVAGARYAAALRAFVALIDNSS